MGSWQLEIFRMALYITFPVGLFHWFNHSESIQEWANEARDKPRFQVDKEAVAELEEYIEELNRKKHKRAIEEMELEYNSHLNMASQ